ncbi:MAG TPA: carbonic anhydrase [Longimicrobiales bacterium]|nr:carbonic anhydrase [Longimicrobiales bacterium]
MPEHLIAGLRNFRRETFPRYREHYQRLVDEGQRPTTLFIGCSDSRIVPDLLMQTGPGELFIVRNMGGFVPPFEPDEGFHGTSAAIEFAVLTLGVTDIVVCAHSHCGAIRALYDPPNPDTPHISRWLTLGQEARLDGPPTPETLRASERRSVAVQLERLLGYPPVRARVDDGTLSLHGWLYVLEEGQVLGLDIPTGAFLPVADD